jgi:hypothetical protein
MQACGAGTGKSNLVSITRSKPTAFLGGELSAFFAGCWKVLRGEIAVRTQDLLRRICQGREVVIVQGAVSPDHVHMLVNVPPQLAPVKLVQYMKGRSSRMPQD